MTTIATDGKSMAGDSLGCASNKRQCLTEVKVRRLDDGRIVGFSGTASTARAYIDWLNGGPPVENNKEDSFHLLILALDGTATILYPEGTSDPVDLPAALGSGGDIALGAMLAGKSPKEAVEIAILRDVWSGGKVTVETLKESDREE